jgi:hypothetical protein
MKAPPSIVWLRLDLRQLIAMFPRPVGDVAFKIADANGQPFAGAHADRFALCFLGTDAAGDGGQSIIAEQALRGLGELAGGEQIEKFRNVHAHGTAVHAAWIFALQATVGFQERQPFGQAEIHFEKIRGARGGVLFRHGLPGDLHPLFGGDSGGHIN